MVILAADNYTSNAHLIEAVAGLGFIRPDDETLDPTYGKGVWWRRWRPERLVTHCRDEDLSFDFRKLPYDDGSFDVVAYDPPYVLQGGRETTGIPEFQNRYGLDGVPKTYPELRALIDGGLEEAYRVLRDPRRVRVNGKWRTCGGVCLFKCANFIWSSQFVPAAFDGLDHARGLGFELVQCMEVVKAARPQPKRTRADGFESVQENARNNVSYLFVLRRPARTLALDV